MIEFVRQHVLLIVSGLVIWMAWSSLSEEGKGDKDEKSRREPVPARYLAVRADDEPAPPVDDPYRLEQPWVEAALEESPDGDGEAEPEMAPAPDDTLVSVKVGAAQDEAEADGATAPRGPVRLWVDAVLASPEGGRARVCGQSVGVGQAVPGVDAESPPVLLAVRGTTVDVDYRGQRYELSLDGQPVEVFAAAPSAEPPAAAAVPSLLGTLLKGLP